MERNNVSIFLSCVYPFDTFLSFFQSTITPTLLNSYISIHLNPTLIHIYPFLSFTHLRLAFSIIHLYIYILFYLPYLYPYIFFFKASLIFNYPNLLESQSLYPILALTYPCLSFSILYQSKILFIFLNLYLLIHINTFLSFLQYKSPLSF